MAPKSEFIEFDRKLYSELAAGTYTSYRIGLLAINTAGLTAYLCQISSDFRSKRYPYIHMSTHSLSHTHTPQQTRARAHSRRYFSPMVREAISDFGPPLVILSLTW